LANPETAGIFMGSLRLASMNLFAWAQLAKIAKVGYPLPPYFFDPLESDGYG
jgi:hypothetical protein